jgi:large subunit ribosomal protein L15
MKAPVRIKLRAEGGRHDVNKDPRKLDEMYVSFLGRGGDKMLSEETKWLAVTHKSFDHGRRGFNDRLAFLGRTRWSMREDQGLTITQGRRIIELQASLGLLNISDPSHKLEGTEDPYGRTPFSDPALDGVESLTSGTRTWLTYHRQLSKIAGDYGIPAVMRWVPKNVCSVGQQNVDILLTVI